MLSKLCKAGIVFLHGTGDTGNGLRDWINHAHPSFLRSLQDNGVCFRFPTAPLVPYTLFNGELANVWHDRTVLSQDSPEDTVGIKKSVNTVDDCIESLFEEGVPRNNIILFGFSMGGHLALQSLIYSKFQADIKGLVPLSCFLSSSSLFWKTFQPVQASSEQSTCSLQRYPPVLMFHGARDALIPLDWGRNTAESLKNTGFPVSFQILRTAQHELTTEELQIVYKWINDIIN